MIKILDKFSGLDNRTNANLLSSSQAQDLSNVSLDSQGLMALNGPGATLATGIGTLRSLYKFAGNFITDAIAWQYAEWGGNLYRAAVGQSPQKSTDGLTWYSLGIPSPVAAPVTSDSGTVGLPNGTYQWVYTYTSVMGGESAPSPLSTALPLATHKGNVNVIASTDPQVNGIRVYRAGGSATYTGLVASLPNTTATYLDNTADSALGSALATATYGTPGQLSGLVVTPYSVFIGWIGRRLYFTENALPDAWTVTNYIDFKENIVAVVPYSGIILVLTAAAPYILLGTDASTYRIQNTMSAQGCLERDTALDMGAYVAYLSRDGICFYTGNYQGTNTQVVSKNGLSDAFMAGISPVNAKAVRYKERYALFHSGGFLEYDPRIDGNWKKGSVICNAVHYNRTDAALYVAQGSNVSQWEAGAPLAMTYQSGDWVGDAEDMLKHWRRFAMMHNGTNTISIVIDGVTVVNALTLTTATLARSIFFVPPGCRGRRVSVIINGTGPVYEVLGEFTEAQRA